MPLIVETGAVVPGADSYVSLVDADAYLANRNKTGWTAATVSVREACLREAAQYLDASYTWLGHIYSELQVLAWPRVVSVDLEGRFVASDSIPQAIKNAQCELAEYARNGGLAPALDRGGKIQSQTLGPLSQSFFESAPGNRTFPLIDLLVKNLVEGGSGGAFQTSGRG